MEILKNCHRECIVKTKEHCTFLTMKQQLLKKEIFEKHKEFLKILADNSSRRCDFYSRVKTFISRIIDNGKLICSINPEILEKLKENPLSNIHNECVKIYFCVGLLQYEHELMIKKQITPTKKLENKIESFSCFTIKKDRTEIKKKLLLLKKDQRVRCLLLIENHQTIRKNFRV